MTNKPSQVKSLLSTYWNARRDRTDTGPDYEILFHESQASLESAVFDLASANNHIAILKEQLTMATDHNLNSIVPRSVSGKLDIPVDLGDGTIVIISGMPGRPTRAACERLCNIIMSYAFTSAATQATKVTSTLPETLLLKDEDLSGDGGVTKAYKLASLGSRTTGTLSSLDNNTSKLINPEV